MNTAEQFMNKLRTIFYAIVVGPLTFFLFAYLERSTGEPGPMADNAELLGILQMIVPFFCLSAVAGGSYLYKSQLLAQAKQQPNLSLKLNGLLTATLVKVALIEGGSIFAAVCYYLFGHPVFIVAFVICLIALMASAPNADRVIKDLQLNAKEADIIRSGGELDKV